MITERTPLFYMANLGPEVTRYFNFLEKGENALAEASRQRILDMTEKILAFDSMQARRGEIETLISVIQDPTSFGETLVYTKRQLENYFSPFIHRILQTQF
ncbi:MAG: hypothetical protein AAB447_03595 [Patescibacteria group bacterium]